MSILVSFWKSEAWDQTVLPDRTLLWKMPKFNNSNATFWVIFKQCAPFFLDNEVIKIKIRSGKSSKRTSLKSPKVDISEGLQKEFPNEAFYAPPPPKDADNEETPFDKKSLPKTCNTIGLWLFLLSNLIFICIFAAVSVHYYNTAGGGFGICMIP